MKDNLPDSPIVRYILDRIAMARVDWEEWRAAATATGAGDKQPGVASTYASQFWATLGTLDPSYFRHDYGEALWKRLMEGRPRLLPALGELADQREAAGKAIRELTGEDGKWWAPRSWDWSYPVLEAIEAIERAVPGNDRPAERITPGHLGLSLDDSNRRVTRAGITVPVEFGGRESLWKILKGLHQSGDSYAGN